MYVALSRVTSLEGLHLNDLAGEKIIANKSALAEYNRLRSLYTPHLACFPVLKRRPETLNMTNTESNNAPVHTSVSDTDGPVYADAAAVENSGPPLKRNKRRTMRKERIHVNQPTATTQTQNMDLQSLNSQNITNIYKYCNIGSLDAVFKETLCNEMNLAYQSRTQLTTARRSPMEEALQQLIYRQTDVPVTVHISLTSGDGNCLFRALSRAVSQHEGNHAIIRDFVVNYMHGNEISTGVENAFGQTSSQNLIFRDHIVAMQQPGTWGTDQEIVAAAHLFNCSILCCVAYNTTHLATSVFSISLLTSPPTQHAQKISTISHSIWSTVAITMNQMLLSAHQVKFHHLLEAQNNRNSMPCNHDSVTVILLLICSKLKYRIQPRSGLEKITSVN